MSFSFTRYAFGAGCVLAVAACSPPPCDPDTDDCDDGGTLTVIDICNDKNVTDPRCVLTLCGGPNLDAGFYINALDDGGMDQDWYSVQLGTLTGRSLLHVSAGYSAPATAVDLSVTVLSPDGLMAIATGLDDHGQKPPSLVDIIVPYSMSNAKLLILVSDKGNRIPPVFDERNPYSITACVQDNPDPNEPNDTVAMATPLPLAGSPSMGSITGAIATANDVDWYSFDPGTLSGRNIVYVHITTPSTLMPPAAYRLEYTLYDPNMVPVAQGVTATTFDQVDLAVAKLITVSGVYTLMVDGHKEDPGDPTPVPGDIRQIYTVNVQILPDLDTSEPNDSMAQATTHPMSLSVGNSLSVNGRLSYLPDPEWLAIDVAASGSPATLHAKFSVASTGNRFAPLSLTKDRQMRIMAAVPGALAQSVQDCLTNPTICPRGYDPMDTTEMGLVDEICNDFVDAGSAQCLWAERNEYSEFPNLKNLEAVIPIAAHGGTLRYWIQVGSDGENYADDLPWTVDLSLDPDPDESVHGLGMVEMDGISSTTTGVISYGMGRLTDHMPNNGDGVRGPADYDAIPTDQDMFTFSLPGGMDTTWNLTWELTHVDGGSVPEQLALDIEFCDGANNCDGAGTLTYESGNLGPWYSSDLTARVPLYGRTDNGSFDSVTLLPPACMCFQSKYTKMNITVNGTDRDYYGPLNYKLIQSTSAYPQTYTADGGTVSCPPEGADGGGGCKLGSTMN